MMGLGYEHGAFQTLEDTGNFRLEKGIFVPTHRVPVLRNKEHQSGVNPPPFAQYKTNKDIPSRMTTGTDFYRQVPGVVPMKHMTSSEFRS